MNLRISPGQLRFRITYEELSILFQGEVVELILPLLQQRQRYIIRCESLPVPLALYEEEAAVTLRADRSALGKLAEQLPSRKGLEYTITSNGESLLLVLEVDVKRVSTR